MFPAYMCNVSAPGIQCGQGVGLGLAAISGAPRDRLEQLRPSGSGGGRRSVILLLFSSRIPVPRAPCTVSGHDSSASVRLLVVPSPPGEY